MLVAVREVAPVARVIVVDDGSTDGTDQVARWGDALVRRHGRNLGKGAALRTGLTEAVTGGAAFIVTLDADGQHPPREIPRLLAPLLAGSADLVLGARPRAGAMPLSRRATNWVSSVLASRIAGIPVPDAQTGFRAFTRAVAERVQPEERHYDWELAFLLGAAVAGFRLVAVTVPTLYGAPSHFGHVTDTARMMRVFARHAGRLVWGAQ